MALSIAVAGTAEAGGRTSVRTSSSSTRTYSTSSYSGTYQPTHNYKYTNLSVSHYPNSTSYPLKSTVSSSYVSKFGTPFSYGVYYKGFYQKHWSSCCWSSKYGCCLYYDPFCRCNYYWCQPAGCYYPLSYITIAPPVVVTYSSPVLAVAAPTVLAAAAATPPPPPAPIEQ
jgi:hypothetical protein